MHIPLIYMHIPLYICISPLISAYPLVYMHIPYTYAYVYIYGYVISFLIHPSDDGYLDSFHILPIVHNAATNTGAHVSL